MQAGVQTCGGRSSWFKMHVAVLTAVWVKGPVVNQHASSLYTDVSFLVTPHKPENWTLQGAQHSFLSAEIFQLLLLPLIASAGSWKEQQVPFISSEESSIILLLCRSGIYSSSWEDVKPGRHVFMPHICIYTYLVWRDTSIHTCKPRQSRLKQWHRFCFATPMYYISDGLYGLLNILHNV